MSEWYQEGVAEYFQDKIDKFNREAETRMQIRSGQAPSLRELMEAQSMLFSAGDNLRGGGGARGNYGLAASIILFLREGPRKDAFERFLLEMGRVPRSDIPAIEHVLSEVYDLTIEELEAEWKEHFAG